MFAASDDASPLPLCILRVLIPWFALPVFAGPLAMLLIVQDAGAWVGLDHAGFRLFCLAMLAGLFEIWVVATLCGAAVAGVASWRRRRDAKVQGLGPQPNHH